MLVMFRLSTYAYPSDPWSKSKTLPRPETISLLTSFNAILWHEYPLLR